MRCERTTIYSVVWPVCALLLVLFQHTAASPQNTQEDDEEALKRIVALDPRWTTTFDTLPNAVAGFDDRTAYVPLKGGQLVAVNLDDGAVRWKVDLETAFTPTTGDGLVFVGSEGLVTAFDQRTGATVWRTPIDGSLALPPHWDTGWVLITKTSGELWALKAEDGTVSWKRPLGAPLAAAPSSDADRVYVALSDRRIVALNFSDGQDIWSVTLDGEASGLLALDKQLLVGTLSNQLFSLSLRSGRIRWRQKAGADLVGAPVADEEHIYFVAMDNVVRAVDRDNGNLRWIRAITLRPAGGLTRAGDLVIVPLASTEMMALRAETGAPAFSTKAGGELASVPFMRETSRPTAPRLIAMNRDGALQGFASRIDPAPVALSELPGVKVGS